GDFRTSFMADIGPCTISTSPACNRIHPWGGILSEVRIISSTETADGVRQISSSSLLPTAADFEVTSASVRYCAACFSSLPSPAFGRNLRPTNKKYGAHTAKTTAATVVKSKNPNPKPDLCSK